MFSEMMFIPSQDAINALSDLFTSIDALIKNFPKVIEAPAFSLAKKVNRIILCEKELFFKLGAQVFFHGKSEFSSPFLKSIIALEGYLLEIKGAVPENQKGYLECLENSLKEVEFLKSLFKSQETTEQNEIKNCKKAKK